MVEKPVDLALHDFMDQKYKIVEPPIANDDDDEEEILAEAEEKQE